MRVTIVLCEAARTPLIKFIGKRAIPGMINNPSLAISLRWRWLADQSAASVDHTPRAHPASPSQVLPDSFAAYRSKAQQHGPLNSPSRASFLFRGAIGSTPGSLLGPVEPKQGEFFDRIDLPTRFHRMPWTEAEIEAVETGGASLFP
jgi:small subunit ribosomal protein YMR-31